MRGVLDKPRWIPPICKENKNKKEAIMEIECNFHFKLVRKPKTKKVTLVVEDEG